MLKKSDKIAYHQKSVKDLLADLLTAQKKLVEIKIKVGLVQEKNHAQLKKIKYNISLLKTVLNQKVKLKHETQPKKN